MISFIPSFEIINGVVPEAKCEGRKYNIRGQPDLNIFLWTAASVADAPAVNPNGINHNWFKYIFY